MKRVAIVFVLVACNSGSSTPDSTVMIDSVVPEPVTIEVRTFVGDGAPELGANVIFYDENNVEVSHGPVDLSGRAEQLLPNGGSVVVMVSTSSTEGFDRQTRLTWYRGVESGDHLFAGFPRSATFRSGPETTMDVQFTRPFAGGGYYGVITRCGVPGFGTNQITLTFSDVCVTPTFDMFVVADDSANAVRHYAWLEDQPYSPGGTVTVPDVYPPAGVATQVVLNPPDVTRVFTRYDLLLDGMRVELDQRPYEGPATPSHTFMLSDPTGLGDGRMLTTKAISGFTPIEMFVQTTSTNDSAFELDFASMPLPVPRRPSRDTTGVTWTESGTGNADARIVVWVGSFTGPDSVHHAVQWHIIEPPDGSTTTNLPMLPSEYSMDDSLQASSVSVQESLVSYVDYDHLAGYAEARVFGAELRLVEDMFVSIPHRVHLVNSY